MENEDNKLGFSTEMLKEQIKTTRIVVLSLVAVVCVSLITIGCVTYMFTSYLSQYDFSSETTTVEYETTADSDGSGDAVAIYNTDGEVTLNGESDSESN